MAEIFADIQTELAFVISLGLAGYLAYLSIRHFREKGKLLNNASLFASKEEKEKMDPKPYYRQSAIIFLLLSLAFLSIACHVFSGYNSFLSLVIILIIATLVYTVRSTIKIEKERRAKEQSQTKKKKKKR